MKQKSLLEKAMRACDLRVHHFEFKDVASRHAEPAAQSEWTEDPEGSGNWVRVATGKEAIFSLNARENGMWSVSSGDVLDSGKERLWTDDEIEAAARSHWDLVAADEKVIARNAIIAAALGWRIDQDQDQAYLKFAPSWKHEDSGQAVNIGPPDFRQAEHLKSMLDYAKSKAWKLTIEVRGTGIHSLLSTAEGLWACNAQSIEESVSMAMASGIMAHDAWSRP